MEASFSLPAHPHLHSPSPSHFTSHPQPPTTLLCGVFLSCDIAMPPPRTHTSAKRHSHRVLPHHISLHTPSPLLHSSVEFLKAELWPCPPEDHQKCKRFSLTCNSCP